MVLVDTSVWIRHLRKGNRRLEELLLEGHVVCHPFIMGELGCGNMRNWKEALSLLQTLPKVTTASIDELLHFIEQHKLMGLGIGFVDAHLLASARLANVPLWTSDKKLKIGAAKLKVLYR